LNGNGRNEVLVAGMKITAAVLGALATPAPYAASQPLALTELTLDPPRPGELLVRIEAAGLCHSDLSVINGDRARPLPMALGHEAVATVVATGDPADTLFRTGDRVVLSFLPACGECVRCLGGEGYLCANGAASNGAGTMLRGGCRLHDAHGDVHHHLGI
jgi:alcohol dehydrogenase